MGQHRRGPALRAVHRQPPSPCGWGFPLGSPFPVSGPDPPPPQVKHHSREPPQHPRPLRSRQRLLPDLSRRLDDLFLCPVPCPGRDPGAGPDQQTPGDDLESADRPGGPRPGDRLRVGKLRRRGRPADRLPRHGDHRLTRRRWSGRESGSGGRGWRIGSTSV